eukprot:TRINITY_DN1592_c0_g1_i1.p1 TRINITY_DN1592_c0_g1~~TRINITY_DN1592_c0_g1_i1.p1  ORF type:complete len:311 (+),score=33.98 TRINITY_DN1592_c0_g1_i1:54-986(+)
MLRAGVICLLLVLGHAGTTRAVDDKGQVLLSVGVKLKRATDPHADTLQRAWEAWAGTGNTACRGKSPTDNNDSYYEVFRNISSVDGCKALCEANQPRCKGMEYSPGRCEMWTREEGIASWSVPQIEGRTFTCQRYGWPAWFLQPMEGGSGRACRGEHAHDKSNSYFVNSTVGNLEDCRALCVAADVCRGLQFSAFARGSGRCEIWKRAIGASRNRSGHICLRFEPPSASTIPTQPPTGTTTSQTSTISTATTTTTTTTTTTSSLGRQCGEEYDSCVSECSGPFSYDGCYETCEGESRVCECEVYNLAEYC